MVSVPSIRNFLFRANSFCDYVLLACRRQRYDILGTREWTSERARLKCLVEWIAYNGRDDAIFQSLLNHIKLIADSTNEDDRQPFENSTGTKEIMEAADFYFIGRSEKFLGVVVWWIQSRQCAGSS